MERPRRLLAAGLALLATLAVAGCGGGSHSPTSTSAAAAEDPYVAEPFSHQQKLVALGARLIVSEGCSSCHLIAGAKARAPSFTTFAGHRVTLANGKRVLVDEHLIEHGLLDPRAIVIRGYDPQPMIRALQRLHLAEHPARVAALAAFIEEVGPEPD